MTASTSGQLSIGSGAELAVLEIDTPGGRVDAAWQIVDALRETGIPTAAYINHRALSAGAMIALAADELSGLSGEGKKQTLTAKAVANCPAYKPASTDAYVQSVKVVPTGTSVKPILVRFPPAAVLKDGKSV